MRKLLLHSCCGPCSTCLLYTSLDIAWTSGDIDDIIIAGQTEGEQSSSGPVSYTHLDVYKRQSIGCDYGGNLSKTVFVATLILKNMKGVCVLEAKKLEGKKGEISPDTVEREFISFYKMLVEKYDYPCLLYTSRCV